MEYRQWIEEWLEYYVKPSVKEKTYHNYKEVMRLHVLPYLGEYELDDLHVETLQVWVNHLSRYGNCKTGKGLSPGTVGLVLTVLQKSLRSAVEVDKIEVQYSDRIKHPKREDRRIQCFTLAEQKKIECAILKNPRGKYFGVLLCLYTGMRIGELLALRWEDVDLKKCVISINSTCRDGYENGKHIKIIDTPKTKSSRRIIPVPIQIVPHLRLIKKMSRSEYVISSPCGEIPVRTYQKAFSSLLNKLDIEHRSFHALRHTFATRALECGMDIRTLAEILGHQNPNITLNRYAHSMMEHKIAMMNRVGQFLK